MIEEFSMCPGRRHLAVAVIVILLAGCAGSPPPAPNPAGKQLTDLYDGKPATVHATEIPASSATEGVQRGDLAWRQGNLDLALFMYVQALQFTPEDAVTMRKIGAIHEKRGNRTLARKAFELALSRGGDHAATLERLGLIYLQEELNDNAAKLLSKAVEIEPGRWRAHNGLGVLADRRGEPAAALLHYGDALVWEPKAGIVYNNRGYSRFLAGDLLGAEKDLREAIRLGSGDRAWLNLGKVQAKTRQYGMAFQSFLETLDTARAYNEVGEAAFRNRDYRIAKAYFENAANEAPSYFERAHKNIALANEELKKETTRVGS
jgi:Tfp pilus assembly protein PilF